MNAAGVARAPVVIVEDEGADDWDDVWIVVPAYNEARTIRAITEAALALCPRVIVVDDASTDATPAAVRDLPSTLLTHAVNGGKAAALRTAFRHALQHGARAVITLDGDGQHDPHDASALLARWRQQPEGIVLGARLHDRASFPRSRYIANRVACFFISCAAGHTIADSQTGFRVYPAAVMALALDGRVRSDRFAFESELLIEAARSGHATCAVPIAAVYPEDARASHYRALVDTTKIVLMLGRRLLHPRPNRRDGAKPRSLSTD